MANLGPNLSQRLSQSQTLALTPAMQLKLKLWQMNLLELSQTIERELGENPLLELLEDGDEVPTLEALEEGHDSEVVDSAQPQEGTELSEGGDSVDLGPLPEGSVDLGPEASREEGISQVQETEIGAENSWDTELPRTSSLPEDERTSWEDRLSSTETLQEHLLAQLYETLEADDPRAGIMESLIDHVDPKGFLRVDPDLATEITPAELAQEMAIDQALLRELLDILQEFDPSGVGCFTVQESLLLQLRHAGAEPDDLAVRIIQDHCDLLSQRDNVKLRKAIGCSEEDLCEALALLRHLHPAPGRAFDPESERVVKPDVVVLKGDDDTWKVYLNGERRVPAFPGLHRSQGRQGLHPGEVPLRPGFHPRGGGPEPHRAAGFHGHRGTADGIHETRDRAPQAHGAPGRG
jgi:RNA polymerase sigma-54 factor